jgi:hypothetical protein
MRYDKSEIEQLTHEALRDGFCILRDHFSAEKTASVERRVHAAAAKAY